jgi:hypothetical protein
VKVTLGGQTKRWLIASGAIVLGTIAAIWSWASFGAHPVFLQELPLLSDRREADSPEDAAWLYYSLYFKDGSDPPKRERVVFSTLHASAGRAALDLIASAEDDSVYVTCHRISLERAQNGWRVTRHQTAWQGRGRLGWTTRPTS